MVNALLSMEVQFVSQHCEAALTEMIYFEQVPQYQNFRKIYMGHCNVCQKLYLLPAVPPPLNCICLCLGRKILCKNAAQKHIFR